MWLRVMFKTVQIIVHAVYTTDISIRRICWDFVIVMSETSDSIFECDWIVMFLKRFLRDDVINDVSCFRSSITVTDFGILIK